MKERDGQFIRIYWECGEPSIYVRGHVSEESFTRAIAIQGIARQRYGRIRHAFASYCPSKSEDFDMRLLDYFESGRGRFKVTRADEVAGGTR